MHNYQDDPHMRDLPPGFVAHDSVDGDSLLRMSFPEIRYVVPGYIAEGLTLLGGRPKVGKSWMALDMALAVAAGGHALGSISCCQGDVLYLALEDNLRRLQSRIEELIAPLPTRPSLRRISFRTVAPRLDDGLIDTLDTWRERVPKPTLVVIDVLAMVRGARSRGESVYDFDYRCLSELQRWASESNVAVLVVHHVRKSEADDPLEMMSGSNGVTGAADTVLVLKRDGQGTTLYGRGRDIEEIETAVERNRGQWTILGDAETIRKSDQRKAILSALEDAGEPLGPRDIAEATEMRYDGVRTLLKKMTRDGDVTVVTRGKYISGHNRAGSEPPKTHCDPSRSYPRSQGSQRSQIRKDDLKTIGYDIENCDPSNVTPVTNQQRKNGTRTNVTLVTDVTALSDTPPNNGHAFDLLDDMPAFLRRVPVNNYEQ